MALLGSLRSPSCKRTPVLYYSKAFKGATISILIVTMGQMMMCNMKYVVA